MINPTGKGEEQGSVIDIGCCQGQGPEPARLIILHVQLEAIPPATACFALPCPRPERAVLAGASDFVNRHGRGIVHHDRIALLRLPIRGSGGGE